MSKTESGHWYDSSGNPHHTMVGKNGKERNTTLRDAKKHSWYPSVSGILSVLAKPALDRWKAMQITEACFNHQSEFVGQLNDNVLRGQAPAAWDTPLNKYHSEMMEKAFQQVTDAADAGTLIHNGCELALQGLEYDEEQKVYLPQLDAHFELKTFVEPVMRWVEENEVTYNAWELRLCNQAEGYAGTTDAAIKHKRGFGILDYKTKKTMPGKPVLAYDENCMQIAAYHVANYHSIPEADSHAIGCNLFVSTTEPGRVDAVWHEPDRIAQAYDCFLGACKVWRYQKGYDPRNL